MGIGRMAKYDNLIFNGVLHHFVLLRFSAFNSKNGNFVFINLVG